MVALVRSSPIPRTNVDSFDYGETLTALLSRRDLSDAMMRGLVRALVRGEVAEPEAAALLIALRMK